MNYESHQSDNNPLRNAIVHGGTASDYYSRDYISATDAETYESLALPGTASGSPTPDLHTSPTDFHILREVIEGLSTEQNDQVRELTVGLLGSFRTILAINRNTIESSRNLPPLTFRRLDDGAALIEWIFKDFRIGGSIETNKAESTWYLVSNQNLNEASKSGPLNEEVIDTTLSEVFAFVLNFT